MDCACRGCAVLLVQGASACWSRGFSVWRQVMLISDNVVQPALIGGTTRLPFLLVLIGILGGLQTFGLIGLFIGPVIMAALLAVWREWVCAGN